jgi:hypothetical protein
MMNVLSVTITALFVYLFVCLFVCRVRVLAVCTLVLSIAILLMGSIKEFWHLVLLRMVLAAG